MFPGELVEIGEHADGRRVVDVRQHEFADLTARKRDRGQQFDEGNFFCACKHPEHVHVGFEPRCRCHLSRVDAGDTRRP